MVKNCDTILYKLICEKSKNMPHDEMYYALLDWADQHQEVREQLAMDEDEYYVEYILKSGEKGYKSFKINNCCEHNPYIEARIFYGKIKENCTCCELWHKPNPYIMGVDRKGKLILSYDVDEEKKDNYD